MIGCVTTTSSDVKYFKPSSMDHNKGEIQFLSYKKTTMKEVRKTLQKLAFYFKYDLQVINICKNNKCLFKLVSQDRKIYDLTVSSVYYVSAKKQKDGSFRLYFAGLPVVGGTQSCPYFVKRYYEPCQQVEIDKMPNTINEHFNNVYDTDITGKIQYKRINEMIKKIQSDSFSKTMEL